MVEVLLFPKFSSSKWLDETKSLWNLGENSTYKRQGICTFFFLTSLPDIQLSLYFFSFSASLEKKPISCICGADLNALFWSRVQINAIFYYMLVTVIVVKYSLAQRQCFFKDKHRRARARAHICAWFLFDECGKPFIFSQWWGRYSCNKMQVSVLSSHVKRV